MTQLDALIENFVCRKNRSSLGLISRAPLTRSLITAICALVLLAYGRHEIGAATPSVMKSDDGSAALDQAAFLELTVPKTNAYLGEVIEVTLDLYVQNPQDVNMPLIRANGFTLGPLAQPARSRKQLGNKSYERFSFKAAAAPIKTGPLSIGPAECTLVIRRRKPPDRRDAFGNPIGGGTELQRASISSNIRPILIRSLPKEDQPRNFSGAVGNYSIAVSANPTTVSVGDPITMTVRIGGMGAVDTVVFPPQDTWREFKSYPPTARSETSDTLGLTGMKTFEIALSPKHSEIKEIPPFVFSFFNPNTESYVTLTQPPIPLSVRPSSSPRTQLAVAARESVPAGLQSQREWAHIKTSMGNLVSNPAPFITRPWFFALQTTPCLFWVAAVIWRNRLNRRRSESRSDPHNRVKQFVRQNLDDLERLSDGTDSEEFFATAFRLLEGLICERFQLPASDFTESNVLDLLHRHGAPQNVRSEIQSLMQLCDQARYAPGAISQDLKRLMPRITQTTETLVKINSKTLQ